MSTNKTCAISNLRWRPVSALIYGFANLSKHESALPLSPKFLWNNRKQKKFLDLEDGRRKCWTILKERIVLTLELELLAALGTGGGTVGVSPRMVDGLFHPASMP